eukprot:7892578-Alexandrium_andersonii.AAC.1
MSWARRPRSRARKPARNAQNVRRRISLISLASQSGKMSTRTTLWTLSLSACLRVGACVSH